MSTTARRDEARRRHLLNEGFCQVPDILDDQMLRRLASASTQVLDAWNDEEKETFRAQGSMIQFSKVTDCVYADLIAWPKALAALASLGFDAPTYTDGYQISKPPDSPPLFWHYDWFSWSDPAMRTRQPQQLFCMYYLSDTTRENGCLRVIPGSHAGDNPLHAHLAEPHSSDLSRADDLERVEFSTRPDEVDVPVRAGSLLVGDARLLHATHPNQGDAWRTVLTLWYQPDFAGLPEDVRAQMVAKTQPVPDAWPEDAKAKVAVLHPVYAGEAERAPRTLRPAKLYD